MTADRRLRRIALAACTAAAAALAGAVRTAAGDCGPFTDVSFFCAPILELYYLGVASGTSPTTFAPDQTTTRGEVAAFVARAFNQSSKRSSRRAALGQWWINNAGPSSGLGLTTLPGTPYGPACDGADVWVANGGTVSRVRGSDGKILETRTAAANAVYAFAAMGRVFASGGAPSGAIYMIDPAQPAGDVATVATIDDAIPVQMAFDGSRLWTQNSELPKPSISIVTPAATSPWSVTTLTAGFGKPAGILFDGSNVWVVDAGATPGNLRRLDANGAVVQSVPVGGAPGRAVFDGANIWVPNFEDNSITVARASSGAVVTTLTGNGLDQPLQAGFDGARVLITNLAGDHVSLFDAATLSPLGTMATPAGGQPFGVCSDGVNFWVAMTGTNELARF